MSTEYRTITLVTRNADCGKMTSEEFINAMFNDVLEAVDNYDELYSKEYVNNELKYAKNYINNIIYNAKKYSMTVWKTEARRARYVNDKTIEAKHYIDNKKPGYYSGITFFDFDVEPWTNGIQSECCLSVDRLTRDALKNCFNAVKDNKYFKAAHGWKLQYTAKEGSYCNSFRPQVTLILDDDMQANMEWEQKRLADEISKFYATTHYAGD